MVSIVPVESRGCRSGKNPLAVLLTEQTGRHGGPGADGLRIGNPALNPIRLEPFFRQQEIWGGGNLVVRGIAGSVALQTGRSRAGEQTSSHVALLGRQGRHLLWNVGQRLLRHRLEKAYEFSKFVVGERERRHADLQVWTHSVAVGVTRAQCRIGKE